MHPIRIVLVGPQHPGNIGSAARAMKTMRLDQLRLVAPERYPHVDATTMAVRAGDVLDAAPVVPEPAAAVPACDIVLGWPSRRRYVSQHAHVRGGRESHVSCTGVFAGVDHGGRR